MDRNTPMIWTGQGPVMIGTFDLTNGRPETGYLTNLYRIGCGTSALTTNLSRQTKQIKESCSGQRLTLKEIETSKEMTASLSLVEFSGRTLAAAMFGTAGEQTGAAVVDEELPPLEAGDYFTLKHPKISALSIEDSTGTPVAYVEDTHYEIEDADQARLKLIAHPVAHTEPLLASYTYGTYTNIAAFSAANVERGIIFNGVNQDGQKARLIIPRISLAMDGDMGWISEEEATLSLGGQVLYVAGLDADPIYGGFARVSFFE
jgi:hypothetical protein